MIIVDGKHQCSKCLDLGISKESVALVHAVTVVEKGREVIEYMPVCREHLAVYNEEHPDSMYLTVGPCLGPEQGCICQSCRLIRQSQDVEALRTETDSRNTHVSTLRQSIELSEKTTARRDDTIVRLRKEMRSGDEALKAQLDTSIAHERRADQHERNYNVLQHDYDKLKSVRDIFFNQVKQLTGDGLVLKGPESFGELTDDAMDFMARDLREDKKILAVKYLRGHTVDFSYALPDGQCTRLTGHISLRCSNRIIGGMMRAIRYERDTLSRKIGVLQSVKHDLTDRVSSLKREVKATIVQRELSERSYIELHEAHDQAIGYLADKDEMIETLEAERKTAKVKSESQTSAYCLIQRNNNELRASITGHEAVNLDLCDQTKELQDRNHVLMQSNTSLEAEKDRYADECKSWTQAIQNKVEYITTLEAERDELKTLMKAEGLKDVLKINVPDLDAGAVRSQQETIKKLNGEIEQRREQVSVQQQTIDELKVKAHELESSLECRRERITKIESLLETWKDTDEKNHQTIETLNGFIESRDVEIERLRTQVSDLNLECNEKGKFTEELSAGLEEKNKIITALEDRVGQQHGILHSIKKQFSVDWDYDETT